MIVTCAVPYGKILGSSGHDLAQLELFLSDEASEATCYLKNLAFETIVLFFFW